MLIALSEVAVRLDWSVEKRSMREVREEVLDARGAPIVDPATQQPLTRAVIDATTSRRADRRVAALGARRRAAGAAHARRRVPGRDVVDRRVTLGIPLGPAGPLAYTPRG